MNIREILDNDAEEYKNKDFVYEKKNGKYSSITYGDFINKSKILATYLIENDLLHKRMLLIGKNSTNYMIADVAVMIYCGIVVNVNRDTKTEELNNIIDELGIDGILYTNEQEEKLSDISIFKLNIDTFDFDVKVDECKFKEYNEAECSKIYFSSGTTSKPKGIMHSIKSVFAGYNSLQKRTKFVSDDVVYLFLPLHHTYANIYNFYYAFMYCPNFYLSSGVEHIFEELKEVNPTIFCAVPLIYERAYDIFKDDIKYAFGDKIKYLYAGGAPLSMELKNNYKKNNLEILNAYALTETASSFAIDYPGDTDEDSVGTIFEDLDVKVIEEVDGVGEIVVKGDALFLGYTSKTDNVFTEDGYFKTGDTGYIKNNKLFITGRKKNILVGSNGENVYPKEIEDKLKELDLNINSATVSLNDNKIEVLLFLKDRYRTNTEELLNKYNSLSTQKNKISSFKISSKNRNDKLL